jgi:hypothetical protein
MAIVTLGHNITRQEDFEGSPGGTFTSIGGGPGAGASAGLHYEGAQAAQRRVGGTGSDLGFMYTDVATVNMLNAGLTVCIAKSFTAIGGSLNAAKYRIGSATTAYYEFLLGDDGTLGDNQDFLAAPKGGYIILPIHAAMTAWQNLAGAGSPNITVVDVYGITHNVGATTGAGDSQALDSVDLTDDGLFLWGGDGASVDGVFQDFADADEGAGLTGAARAGLWTSQNGVFFVYGLNVIGRTDAGTVTNTAFTDSNKTLVFPGGYVNDGFNGLEMDAGNASTVVTLTGVTILGRGRTDHKKYFDTALDVDGTNDEIDITAHGFNTGDQVAYSAEGGADDIGPDATTGVSELVGSGGAGTGDRWFVRRVTADAISLHPTATDALNNTNKQVLTAATAPGENHSLRRRPDTRPDLTVVGTVGTVDLVSCILQSTRNITLTAAGLLDSCNIIGSQFLDIGGGDVTDCIINSPTLSVGQAYLLANTNTELANLSGTSFISGGEGHAIVIDTTAGTVTFVGNTFTGYGPGTADDTGAHDHEFGTTSGVNSGTDEITLAVDNFVTGDPVYYSDEGGVQSIGLTDGTLYYVNRTAASTYTIHATRAAAVAGSSAINLTAGGAETHVLYSANAAFHNSTGGTVTLNVSGGGGTPSVRNSNGSTTIINNNVALTLTGMRDNTEIRVYTAGTTTELDGVENAVGGTSDNRSHTFSLPAGTSVDIRFAHGIAADGRTYLVPPNNAIESFTWPSATATLPITQVIDRNFNNP